MSLSAQHIRAAHLHLKRQDPVMRQVIRQVGPCTLKLQRRRFESLVRAIVAQQISTRAAATILERLRSVVAGPTFTPETLLALSPEDWRAAGISPQKQGYLLDLSQRAQQGELRLEKLGRWSDDDVIEHLVQVKGIGRWTAQMFLIFSLGRLDVVAPDDLGLRIAQQRLYGLAALPDRETFCRVAEPWRPYASIASWYCWRALELRLSARGDLIQAESETPRQP